jgi:zinc/manganese transport system ATP-binding protein
VPTSAPPVLAVDGVDVWLSGRRVLDGVTLSIGEGEFTGLIGSNGAGKTTLLKVILGLLSPSAGRVTLGAGQRWRSNPPVGYVPQKINLDPDLPLRARDLVALGLDGHRFGLPRWGSARSDQVEEALAAVDATGFANARVGTLSGGEQQRVMIAHALISRPRLLLLDEPLANLDIRSGQEVVDLLAKICADQSIAVLISAHDINPLLGAMRRVVYMADGRVATGTTEEVVTTERLSDLYRSPVEVLHVQGRILVVAGTGPLVGLA